jgi:hypothetical protein
MASQDLYERQSWKNQLGTSNLVSWCVRNLRVRPLSLLRFPSFQRYNQRDAYETSWHLIIPPVMTLLDDYEAHYKLQGVEIVSKMLRRVPKDLLKRTGVDGLIRTVRAMLFLISLLIQRLLESLSVLALPIYKTRKLLNFSKPLSLLRCHSRC